MTVIKLIALIIFIISAVTIYHSTNSFEPKKRILYIIIGMLLMYGIICIICAIKSDVIKIDDTVKIKNTLGVIKMFFTPINAIMILSPIGNTIGKAYDGEITTDIATKRIAIFLLLFIIILIFETNYIGDFINNLLGAKIK